MKVPGTQGFVLHDWHAEILALRAFNHFLLQECLSLIQDPSVSSSILVRAGASRDNKARQPFAVREAAKIHMYCSEAPCGDASMESVMDAQEDATPWRVTSPDTADAVSSKLRGRGNFSELGIVRRKPGRSPQITKLRRLC